MTMRSSNGWVLALAAMFVCGVAQAQRGTGEPLNAGTMVEAEPRIAQALTPYFQHYTLVRFDFAAIAAGVQPGRKVRVRIDALDVSLELQPDDILGPHHRAFHTANGKRVEDPPMRNAFWRGRVNGEPDSGVRLLLLPDLVLGMVRSSRGTYMVEPLFAYVRAAPRDLFVLYRIENVVRSAPESLLDDVVDESAAPAGVTIPEAREVDASGKPIVTVATEADAGTYAIYQASTNYIMATFIAVASMYYEDVGAVKLQVGEQHYYTDLATQPYTSDDAAVLIKQFQDEWNANHTTIPRNLAHLVTLRKFNDTTVGKGYIGKVWRAPSQAYGFSLLSQDLFAIMVHELGHNFGLTHYCNACICVPCAEFKGPVMCPCVQNRGPVEFAPYSTCALHNYIRLYAPGASL